ncbi:MAG: 2-amino-4-hydroxy-6-hydroxymethyldihydropteridine diphosphokinase [Alphaproteobacteria bacterium]|nr:2-amino-4-hydroxy-6-hydroxymethyldihydropteridine diphosphokinase [Alphaproteobacteria bacterium]
MILVALGSNLSGPWGTPRETVLRALEELNRFPLRCVKASGLMATKPFGVTNQPDFINAVALVETALPPESLLRKLHMIEKAAGRKRRRRWGPRTLDLDLIAYHDLRRRQRGLVQKALVIPHPGIAARDFVLKPLAEVAPLWKHPQSRQTAAQMLAALRH